MEKQETETDMENQNDLYQLIFTDANMHLYLAQSELLTYLPNFFSQTKRVSCSYSAFFHTLAVVHMNGLAGCNLTF